MSDSLWPHEPQHARPPCPITNSWSLLKLMSIELVIPFSRLILCHPLLLLPSVFSSIRVFSNESALHIRWPKYFSFSLMILKLVILKCAMYLRKGYFFKLRKIRSNWNVDEKTSLRVVVEDTVEEGESVLWGSLIKKLFFILAALGLCCCSLSLVENSRGYSLVVVLRLLTAVASFAMENRL